VIVVHPPLPDVDADVTRDADACRDALATLVRAYIRRYPAQCRYLAFPPWADAADRSSAAVPEEPRLEGTHRRIDAE
jgi:hypothetical protein